MQTTTQPQMKKQKRSYRPAKQLEESPPSPTEIVKLPLVAETSKKKDLSHLFEARKKQMEKPLTDYQLVVGDTKNLQAVIFNKNKWSMEQAGKLLSDNKLVVKAD